MRKIALSQAVERVKRALQIVRLEHLQDRYPHEMSGGQQQRVALARASRSSSRSILVLDEPFGALDRKLREAMQQELREITRNLRITSLFVTHDQEEAMMLSDWVAVMNKGRVEQFGRPNEIFRQPRTRFVADFMGATNFLERQSFGDDKRPHALDDLRRSLRDAVGRAAEGRRQHRGYGSAGMDKVATTRGGKHREYPG